MEISPWVKTIQSIFHTVWHSFQYWNANSFAFVWVSINIEKLNQHHDQLSKVCLWAFCFLFKVQSNQKYHHFETFFHTAVQFEIVSMLISAPLDCYQFFSTTSANVMIVFIDCLSHFHTSPWLLQMQNVKCTASYLTILIISSLFNAIPNRVFTFNQFKWSENFYTFAMIYWISIQFFIISSFSKVLFQMHIKKNVVCTHVKIQCLHCYTFLTHIHIIYCLRKQNVHNVWLFSRSVSNQSNS